MPVRSLVWGLSLFIAGAVLGYGFKKPVTQTTAQVGKQENRGPANRTVFEAEYIESKEFPNGVTCYFNSLSADTSPSCIKNRAK